MVIGNIIEVFLNVNCHEPRPRLSIPKGTIDDTEKLGEGFERIDVGENGFYVALDQDLRKIFVLFGSGLKLVYGNKIGRYITDSICWNIEEYAQIIPPALPKDSRHREYERWLLSNPHLCWPPWARAGVYHWGIWMERGNKQKGSVVTHDISTIPSHVKHVQSELFRSLGALTRGQRILLGAVDLRCQREYEALLQNCSLDKKKFFTTDAKELFALRACLVNVFTEPHFDSGDVKGGWASMGIFGEFRDGDFCITELKRRFAYKVGSLSFLQAERFEHFTMKWVGYRYCIVATCHEHVKAELS
jgi:hypothetical protein